MAPSRLEWRLKLLAGSMMRVNTRFHIRSGINCGTLVASRSATTVIRPPRGTCLRECSGDEMTLLSPERLWCLFDFDGVLRFFDHKRTSALEDRHGLRRGQIYSAAFSKGRLAAVIEGRTTHSDWVALMSNDVGLSAAVEWTADRGYLSASMVDLVRDVRRQGVGLALLSNGTSRLRWELTSLGLIDELDAVFNSAQLGLCKPDPAVYTYAVSVLGTEPRSVLLVDDKIENVVGARKAGLAGEPFRTPELCRAQVVAWIERSRS